MAVRRDTSAEGGVPVRRLWRENGLSIVMFAAFLLFLLIQSLTGHPE